MIRTLKLLLFPAIGVSLLALSVFVTRTPLRLRLLGTPADAAVVGMVISRPEATDVVSRIETELVLTLADGSLVSGSFVDRLPVVSPGEVGPELRRVIYDAVEGDAASVRWSLKREARRRSDPRRVVRIEKTERVHAVLDLPATPSELSLLSDVVVPVGATSTAAVSRVVTRAVFDTTDAARLAAAKGDSMIEYERLRAGAVVTPAKRDFLLFSEPYATEFRPVFRYEVDGVTQVRVSHIGRRGGPTLALRLFRPCRVFHDPARPGQALVVADAGAPDGKLLAWFSRYCEGVFAQWGSAALIALAGAMFIFVGLVVLSFAIRSAGKPDTG
jgi:hypothetical protein